jgi:NADPH:quinone reductase-like Zn-dependent oxidoreductase
MCPGRLAGRWASPGTTAYAAVRAVSPRPGETVAVSGAAGGVGSMAVQLARRAGAEVIGIAGPGNRDWLAAHAVTPVAYGAGLADRLRETAIDAFIDTHGDGYVQLAIELGVAPERIVSIRSSTSVALRLSESQCSAHYWAKVPV